MRTQVKVGKPACLSPWESFYDHWIYQFKNEGLRSVVTKPVVKDNTVPVFDWRIGGSLLLRLFRKCDPRPPLDTAPFPLPQINHCILAEFPQSDRMSTISSSLLPFAFPSEEWWISSPALLARV
ncbi:hypothetical protein E2542_SST31171 [Spatholobus suberectus]|nr:hypothetical protein E2542_SST31171 [Spatholobus suberectus]